MFFKKFKFEDYNLDDIEKCKKKIDFLLEKINSLDNEYYKKIKSLNEEIELLPENKIKEKKKQIEKLRHEFKTEVKDLIENFKNKLPVFIVIEKKYFPIKSEELVKIYSIISNKVFRKEKILFMTKKSFFEIANYFYEKMDYNKIINVIFLKVDKNIEKKLEKICNIKFID